ncbi:hypothetical protein V490_07162 [Pseudogymnoascus sp. VKM F-3557]|nr:hypothetical protein V490_07162 [Pseudogymnoascus sp. VKM F-3557]
MHALKLIPFFLATFVAASYDIVVIFTEPEYTGYEKQLRQDSCTNLDPPFRDNLGSIKVADAVTCDIFESPNCSGPPLGPVLRGFIPDLYPYGGYTAESIGCRLLPPGY